MNSPKVQSSINRLRYGLLPPPRTGICRVRHDRECAGPRSKSSGALPYLGRNYAQNQAVRGIPETVRYNGGKSTVLLPEQWRKYEQDHAGIGPRDPLTDTDRALNLRAFGYATRKQSGWVNYGPWPTIEQLLFGGDFVVVYKISANRCYFHSYDAALEPANYAVDYLNKFSVVFSNDTIGTPDFDVYTFTIRGLHDDPLWIDASDLTFFRPL